MALVRGKDAVDAKIILSFEKSKAGQMLLKTLKSAIANAKNNLSLTVDNLYISDLHVDSGKVQKSGRFVARGRINPILKRTSNIILGLSEKSKKGNK